MYTAADGAGEWHGAALDAVRAALVAAGLLDLRVPSAPGATGGSYVVDNEGLHCIRHALVVFLSGHKLYIT